MVYAISGGPGFGKTTIANLLIQRGLVVCDENARKWMDSYPGLSGFSDIGFPPNFETEMANLRIAFLNSVPHDVIAFSDRGLPDQIAYSWYKKKTPSLFIEEQVLKYRYAKVVFIVPPWKQIYTMDHVRKESFSQAVEIHDYILEAYLKYGYETVNLPLLPPDQRVDFILNYISHLNGPGEFFVKTD
jgi:predicted ATPase